MKEQTTIQTGRFCDGVDKRELVNIDLYNHEMKLIAQQLKAIEEKHLSSKEVQQKVEHFKRRLRGQKKNLEKFRKNCEPEEINSSKEAGRKKEAIRDKSFFEKLGDFENQFKAFRQDANDFVNKWG